MEGLKNRVNDSNLSVCKPPTSTVCMGVIFHHDAEIQFECAQRPSPLVCVWALTDDSTASVQVSGVPSVMRARWLQSTTPCSQRQSEYADREQVDSAQDKERSDFRLLWKLEIGPNYSAIPSNRLTSSVCTVPVKGLDTHSFTHSLFLLFSTL